MMRFYFTLNFKCNQNCMFCALEPNELNSDHALTFKQVINFCKKNGIKEGDIVELSGGEPTLWKDIVDLSSYLSEKFGANVNILSNSQRFSDENFAKEMAEAGLSQVVTTIHSVKPVNHDLVTQRKGSFEKTMKGLKNLEENGIEIGVKVLPTKLNYKELPKFVDFFLKNFKNSKAWLSFNSLEIRGYAWKNKEILKIKFTEIKPYLEKALERAEKYDVPATVFKFPMCLIDPCFWNRYSVGASKALEDLKYLTPIEKDDKDIITPKSCESCIMSERCFWDRKNYIKEFGEAELNPVISR